MVAPAASSSTRDERIAFVRKQWQCLNHCPSCGKCYILKGRDAEELFADYINGTREYIDISKEVRNR